MLFDFFMNMFLVMIVISTFNMIRATLKVRKVLKKYKDDPNVEGITIVNGEVKVIKKQEHALKKNEPVVEMVVDEICGKSIKKDEAYRVFKDGKEYFFCSWECREKFLKQTDES